MVTRLGLAFGVYLAAGTLGACGGVTRQEPPSDLVAGAGRTSTTGFDSQRGEQRASTASSGAGNSGGDSGRGGGSNAAATGGAPQTAAASSGGSETAGAPSLAGARATGSGGSSLSAATTGDATADTVGGKQGLVVHEWGTNTVVSGSDGSLQMGLHHEEEDLPPFVYNRLDVALAGPNLDPVNGNVHVKMETPVLYFYSDKALTVHASVRFPNGVFTQWYPGAAFFRPPIYWESAGLTNANPAAASDPASDPKAMVNSARCLDVYRRNGLLDWGAFEVLAPGSEAEGLREAPLSSYTWSYARNVAANALRFPDKESERFLFYRGLSNLTLPARTEAHGAGRFTLSNTESAPLGAAFVIDVRAERAGFIAYPEGVPALAARALEAPEASTFLPLEAFVNDLSEAVLQALVAQGLYADESRAMVDTWQRQWFRTPGLRVLYLAPQSWTEDVIPLTLDPLPDSLLRVMVVRVELLTPELEAEDRAALEQMASEPSAGQAHFAAAGRFAEPRLRRALALLPSSPGEAYLVQIATQVSRAGALEQ